MNTLYINYTKNGVAVPDHMVEEELLKQADICVNGQDKEYQISTENVVIAARCMKMTDKITCNLEIMFEGNILGMNQYCVINKYPYGFCDYTDRWTTELLTRQMKLKKEDGQRFHP